MATLTHDLASQLRGEPVQQVAQQLGLDPAQASSAVDAALPLLMGALGRNASQPEGAQALFGALQNDHAGGDLGSVLGAVLGGAQNRQTDGAGILGPSSAATRSARRPASPTLPGCRTARRGNC